MGIRGAHPRLSDASIIVRAPLDKSDPSTPVAIGAGVTATARLYDAVRMTNVAADLAATGTALLVDDTSDFAVNDKIAIRLEDTTTIHDTSISAIALDTGTLTLADAIPASRTAKKGTPVLKPVLDTAGAVLAAVSLSLFGTASTTARNWGYIGFPQDDLDLWDLEAVRREVDFSAGAGKRLFLVDEVSVVWSA